uniref:Knr4/Smi1-like domain-containing protein n=2 Tax=Biomphalaria glabrata TaxID=6526 RepID=A0A2C9LK00_BIOGL
MDEINHKNYLDQITIYIKSYLEKKPGICQVKNDIKPPAERPAVLMWEQKHCLLLPEDLKNFFLTCNGFHLTWCVKMENNTVPVGNMELCSISQLVLLDAAVDDGSHLTPSLWDLDGDKDKNGRKLPSFVTSKIFQLDQCQGYGKVCLVYDEVTPKGDNDIDPDNENDFKFPSDYTTEIWFLDRSLRWHFICPTFQAYYRLMLMHLGLPHWQLAFTDIGLPPTSLQWFNLYAPVRLEIDLMGDVTKSSHTAGRGMASSPLDLNKVFKGKSDRKKPGAAQNMASGTNMSKKRQPISSARSAAVAGKHVTASVSQPNVKSK